MRRTTSASLAATTALLAATLVAATTPTQAATAAPADRAAAVPAKKSGGTPDLSGLDVLLTNDDSAQADEELGTDGRGLYEMRAALCQAGADVVVVAPWSQQSGASARITTPGGQPVPIRVQPVEPPAEYAGACADAPSAGPVYGVCLSATPCTSTTPSASPADTVQIALKQFAGDNFWPEGPDVVVSGINVGCLVNHSGTVGAAVTAHEYGVAAVAVSAEVASEDLGGVPFEPAAEFATALLRELDRRAALSPRLLLNVIQPFVGADERLGDPYAVVGTATVIGSRYRGDVGENGGTYQLEVGQPTTETRRRADTTALAANDVPVTVPDGDWTAGPRGHRIRRVLVRLR